MAIYNLTIFLRPKSIARIRILTGMRFNRLLVFGFAGTRPKRGIWWHCLCKCGNTLTLPSGDLVSGHTQSCGCLHKERTSKARKIHGESGKDTPEYRAYCQAKGRCNNKNLINSNDYGGRGIEFRFSSFEEFLNEVGRRPSPKHSLDRIDNNGHYETGNLRWATKKEQANNRRSNYLITFGGKTQTAGMWSDELHIKYNTLKQRLKNGWSIEKTLTTPT